jgi:hypothetical protein
VKTTLLVLLITCFGVWAQTPATNDAASRDAILRRAVRSTLASETNTADAAAPAAATVTPVAASISPATAGTNESAGVQGTSPPPSKTPALRKFQPRIPPLNAANVTNIATAGTNVPINSGVVVNNGTTVVTPTPIPAAPAIPAP